MRLLATHRINTVIDVGANSGQYAHGLRVLGYRGRIISFEPLSSAFAELQRNQARAPEGWEIVNVALGDHPGRAVLNIAGNSYSSSILPMLPAHLRSAPDSRFIGQEEIAVETLDAIVAKMINPSERLFLKSDTQGYDATVLAGAAKSLERVEGIQVEMSIIPLYEGELLLVEMIRYLAERGFTLMSLEPGFADPKTGQLLQTDGIFFRSTS
jgi:FkbM family methyltransferase